MERGGYGGRHSGWLECGIEYEVEDVEAEMDDMGEGDDEEDEEDVIGYRRGCPG